MGFYSLILKFKIFNLTSKWQRIYIHLYKHFNLNISWDLVLTSDSATRSTLQASLEVT